MEDQPKVGLMESHLQYFSIKFEKKVKKMAFDKQACWREILMPALKREGLIFKKIEELSKEEFLWVKSYF